MIDDIKQLTGLEEKQVLEPIMRCNVDMITRACALQPSEDIDASFAAFEQTWKAKLFGQRQVSVSWPIRLTSYRRISI